MKISAEFVAGAFLMLDQELSEDSLARTAEVVQRERRVHASGSLSLIFASALALGGLTIFFYLTPIGFFVMLLGLIILIAVLGQGALSSLVFGCYHDYFR